MDRPCVNDGTAPSKVDPAPPVGWHDGSNARAGR